MKIKSFLAGASIMLAATLPTLSHADSETDAVLSTLREKYPSTPIVRVSKTPIAGVYEFVMGREGQKKAIGYSDRTGRYLIFGQMMDMDKQINMAERTLVKENAVKWDSLPLDAAIVHKKGTGKRVFAVFDDPDCPFCRKLNAEIRKLNDITVYHLPYPIESLHPDAYAKAEAAWCSDDPVAAWETVTTGGEIKLTKCDAPIRKVIEFAEKIQVTGTPTLIRSDGAMLKGFRDAAYLEKWLNEVSEG